MADTLDTPPLDDGPLATSKHRSAAVDATTETLVEAPADGNADTLIGRSVTINRPRQELFAYWRDFANLSTFMENVEQVESLDARRSRWVVKAPAGKTVEWIATITEESDGAFIAWASEAGADVPNSGRVDFRDAQGERGTIVTATILYDPPGGTIGKIVAKLFQREPAIQARRDLRRFKQLMETGEIATGARSRRLQEEGKN
ncbi:SRPBCC family protein [Sphingomonas hengshuiensis]|uniref:Cyclase n=1 Tax=Sphingomonas hengshuiensis TaxID=1609977 RepID=A0A7U4J8D9_9SPHN|nr:SRPBCC family protein [Sphingomonas hengshuiensis]AJP72153.1 cyclase [Sphingomonas hengshuiensis]